MKPKWSDWSRLTSTSTFQFQLPIIFLQMPNLIDGCMDLSNFLILRETWITHDKWNVSEAHANIIRSIIDQIWTTP